MWLYGDKKLGILIILITSGFAFKKKNVPFLRFVERENPQVPPSSTVPQTEEERESKQWSRTKSLHPASIFFYCLLCHRLTLLGRVGADGGKETGYSMSGYQSEKIQTNY